jgi:hypothetical protein
VRLKGEFTIAAPLEEVYRFLVDPSRLAPCLPDLRNYEVKDSDHFTVTIRVGVAHIRGPITFHLAIVGREEPRCARFAGKGSGMGSVVDIQCRFRLEEAADGATLVQWDGQAIIGGTLMSIAGGLLEPLARRQAERFIQSLKAGLEARLGPAGGSEQRGG